MKFENSVLSAVFIIVLNSCYNPKEVKVVSYTIPADSHSFSKPNHARVEHLDLTLQVDFEEKKLKGSARYKIWREKGRSEIILDTDELNIKRVYSKDGDLEYKLEKKDEIRGSALIIQLPENGDEFVIDYETSPTARALQWLNPEQTAQKESPFLFTQSQAILARSWIPCQDSPGIRFTYNAKITVPQGYMALMSAENPQETDPDGSYEFSMPQPIPSYLMALTVGKISFKAIGERTGVYAEPVMLDKCHYEFAQMEQMLLSAESLYGPYAWGRYDVIVLPPSFPFGGMENPRLTFATPTIIAGDRSLTSLVAHELAHSWSGNLVTNATWNDFWLNEGFTVYFEQRIMEAVYGREYSEMLAFLSFRSLQEELKEMMEKNPEDTKLKLNLANRDPDDGMNTIAYDKGYLFLRKIEETIGREKFDDFLKSYFSKNAFKVMDTEFFLGLLNSALSEEAKKEIEVEKWIYQPGLPENHPVILSSKFEKVEEELKKWQNGIDLSQLETKNWSTHEWLHFINSLPADINADSVGELDKTFGFTHSGNTEILAAWFQVAIRSDYVTADPAIQVFLLNVGRRKFLTPLYKSLLNHERTREMAREIYQSARGNYHSVSTKTIDDLMQENT